MKRLILCLMLGLAACTPTDQPVAVNQPALPENDTCGATQSAQTVGQPVTVLQKRAILRPVRIIRPDSAVTLDFRENRLNFILDAADRIVRLTCG